MAQVDVAQRSGGAGERSAAAAADADVFGAVLGRKAFAIEAVVERSDRLAQLPQPGDRRIFLVVDLHRDGLHARRRARQRSRLGLALAEIAPGRIGAAVPALVRFGSDEDDS